VEGENEGAKQSLLHLYMNEKRELTITAILITIITGRRGSKNYHHDYDADGFNLQIMVTITPKRTEGEAFVGS
jgi:hypothetical protein